METIKQDYKSSVSAGMVDCGEAKPKIQVSTFPLPSSCLYDNPHVNNQLELCWHLAAFHPTLSLKVNAKSLQDGSMGDRLTWHKPRSSKTFVTRQS